MERTLRSYVWPLLGYFAILEGMLFAAVWFWPTFRDNLGSLRTISAPLPMLRDMVDRIGDVGVAAYVNGQHFFKGCNTLGVAAAILFSINAVAGEAHRGTLELWLARPFSRRRMLLERFWMGALAVTLPIFLTSATVPWILGLEHIGETMPLGDLMLSSVWQSLFLLAIYGLTFLCSTLGSKPVSIALVMIFVTTLQFALYLVKTLTHWSIFRLVDIEAFARIGAHGLPPLGTAVLTALVLALMGASLHAFSRRVP